jgi:hypothetical protein
MANREADNWTPLFAIADRIGGVWPERIRMAAQQTPRADAESISVQLLECTAVKMAPTNEDYWMRTEKWNHFSIGFIMACLLTRRRFNNAAASENDVNTQRNSGSN